MVDPRDGLDGTRVVGSRHVRAQRLAHEGEDRIEFGPGSDLDLVAPGLGPNPAEDLLDARAAALAECVAGMAGGAAIDGGLAHLAGLGDGTVDRDVRCHVARAQVADAVLDIPRVWPSASPRTGSGLVRFQGDPVPALAAVVPHGHWKTTTFVAGLCLSGLVAPFVFDGAINRSTFQAYVE